MALVEELKARNSLLEERVSNMEKTILDLTRRLVKLEGSGNKDDQAPIPTEYKDERKVTGLLLMDSNRNGISPAGLSFGERKTIIYPCPTLEEIPGIINERNAGEKKIDPDSIVLSSGTNTWDNKSDDAVIDEMRKSATKIKDTWPAAETKIAEFLPRLDKTDQELDQMNRKIKDLANEMGLSTISPRITKVDLRDKKHVSDESKYKLALDLKFALNPKPTQHQRRRPHRINYSQFVNQFRHMARQLNIRL